MSEFVGAGFTQEAFDFNVHQEISHSQDFINRDTYPDHRLYKMLMHWRQEELKPERSERSRQEVATLCGRIAFELLSREKEQLKEEK